MTMPPPVADRFVHSHRCSVCRGPLVAPWSGNGCAVRCAADPTHRLFIPKASRVFGGGDMSQELAQQIPTDESQMRTRVKKAVGIGVFPQDTTPEQQIVMANVALAYHLDPLMGEIIPYQGRPFITIAGRRRLDAMGGHKPGIKFRFLTEDEQAGFKAAGAMEDADLVQICVLTTEWGAVVEGIGRSLASEAKGNALLPQVSRRMEMAQKRAERRAREMAYGPVPRPVELDMQVLVEGDEDGVVEGEMVSAPPKPPPPCPHGNELGNCLDCQALEQQQRELFE